MYPFLEGRLQALNADKKKMEEEVNKVCGKIVEGLKSQKIQWGDLEKESQKLV